ncbi:hypothetical protein EHQ53_08890 [Leptospira langatensis]|uniref:PKD domain-containing protein n=1 Tax=Leptospira langatensis TaxID=2484983 RepID=A0A5F1ZUS6_9LEPT|nr:hypothetical protein [Leptospira langatensis]TGK01258.1 hypothetical protein EHO57_09980 [Leptospira langatensis]TGL42289.1 hypothetical protein EHQ53_08890 [Leptospira langatensis]
MVKKKTLFGASLALLFLSCSGQSNDSSSLLAILGIENNRENAIAPSSCTGTTLKLFTDPLPPESDIQVLQLGQSIILDRSTRPNLILPDWDFFAGDSYPGVSFERYVKGFQTADECYSFSPYFPGVHYIKLCTEKNGGHSCVARGFIIVQGTMNQAPHAVIANISNPVFLGASVSLDMSGSTDPENDVMSFKWSVLAAPEGSTVPPPNTGASIQNFVPDVPGHYALQVHALDGFENPLRFTDEATNSYLTPIFDVRINGNGAPSINLNIVPNSPNSTQAIRFDASASTDPEGESLRLYNWVVLRELANNQFEEVASQLNFSPGELSVSVSSLPEGNYMVISCLADYVPRESGVPGEEQSCTQIPFTVTAP